MDCLGNSCLLRSQGRKNPELGAGGPSEETLRRLSHEMRSVCLISYTYLLCDLLEAKYRILFIPISPELARLSAHSSPPLTSIHVFKMRWIFWLSINIVSTRHPQSSLLFISLSSARPALVTSGKQSCVSVRAFLSMVTIPSLIPQMGYCGKTQALWSESSSFQWLDLKAHCKPMMIQAGGPGSKPSQSKEQSMKCTTGSVYVTTECTVKWREWF